MNSDDRAASSSVATVRRWPTFAWLGGALILLAGLILWVHGKSLTMGLFMDDHAHWRQLRAAGWSLSDLTDACHLDLVGGTIELWWLPRCTLRFFRPVSFGLMKVAYTLGGWQPLPMHSVSLAWHLLACTLLAALLRVVGIGRWLALACAALFAIHPGHVGTVQWIACQSELMVTTFLLAATLCFARLRGWGRGEQPDVLIRTRAAEQSCGTGLRPVSSMQSVLSAQETGRSPVPQPGSGDPTTFPQPLPAREGCEATSVGRNVPLGRGLLVCGVVIFFLLALGCRENAILLPLVLFAADGGWRRDRRGAWGLYAVLGACIVGYLIVRTLVLAGAAVPPKPYVMPPGDPAFVRYVFDKAWYYLLGQFFCVPSVPLAGLAYFQARPLVFYGLALLVLVLMLTAFAVARGPARWLAPAWLVGFMLPLLPVFESPHHLYLPGVGWALAMGLFLQVLAGPIRDAGARLRVLGYLRRGVATLLVLALGGVFVRAATWGGLALRTGDAVEDAVAAEIAATPGLHSGDTLYVCNLPLVAHYTRLAVEEATGLTDLRVVPLTWAPRLLGVATPSALTWCDPPTIEIEIVDDRYFAGPLANLVAAATGQPLPERVDRRSDLGIVVTVLDRDDAGVRRLRVQFDRPANAPGIHLFWGSRARWACAVAPPAAR